MAREDAVIIDTCVWASFFAKPNSAEKRAVDELIDADRVLLVGPVLAEVLIGFRREEQAQWAASRLRMAHWIDITSDDWTFAATLGRRLAAANRGVPLTDLIIAAIAIRTSTTVYTTDPHFDLFPDLLRFQVT